MLAKLRHAFLALVFEGVVLIFASPSRASRKEPKHAAQTRTPRHAKPAISALFTRGSAA